MREEFQLSLKPTSIMEVPLHIYEDFTFIVNGENYKTTKIVADLISNAVCKIHSIDPTINEFTIDTVEKGDFSKIIKLADFDEHDFSKSEFPFASEVLEKIESKYVTIFSEEFEIINDETILDRFHQHVQNPSLYSKYIDQETTYLSSNFYNIIKNDESIENKLTIDDIDRILQNPKLQIESEDQLLQFINKLYRNDEKYSSLYKYIQFRNVSKDEMEGFFYLFDKENLTGGIWNALKRRTIYGSSDIDDNDSRYHKTHKFKYSYNSNFNGILNYLRSKMPRNIFNEIEISSSFIYKNDDRYSPQNVIFYENSQTEFATYSLLCDPYICFDFKERRVVPNYYSIRSANMVKNSAHPKSWVIEGSNDREEWDLLDEIKDNSSLNGYNLVSSFAIKNPNSKKYRFIRMSQTENWMNNNILDFNNFELFGTLL